LQKGKTNMSLQNDMQKLLQKEMDRRDFLKHVGIGFVALTGVAALLKTIQSLGDTGSKSQAVGYGGGAYGGTKNITSDYATSRPKQS